MKKVFLGGAPKCGTSAVFDRLEKEDLVMTSSPKETYYFLEENHPLRGLVDRKSSFDDYFDQTNIVNDTIQLEATTHLMYSQHAFEQISAMQEAKMMFILRNPIDRLVSSFLYTKHNLGAVNDEFHINDYVKALLSKNLEIINKNIHTSASRYVLSQDLEYGSYKEYLERWSDQLGDDLLCLSYHSLRSSPDHFYQTIFDFLGLNFIEESTNAKKNQTIAIKNAGLHRFLLAINRQVRIPKPKWLKSLYLAVQKNEEVEELNDECREMLTEYYADSNDYVKEHFKIDLDE